MARQRKEILDKEAEFFDKKVHAEDWEQGKFYSDPDFKRVDEKWRELIGDIREKKVLAYGCGNDGSTEWALEQGAYVTAIDISPESIEMVKQNALKHNYQERLDAIVMDALHTDFDDDTFDVVFGRAILHHMVDYHGAINEIRRILIRGGVFRVPGTPWHKSYN